MRRRIHASLVLCLFLVIAGCLSWPSFNRPGTQPPAGEPKLRDVLKVKRVMEKRDPAYLISTDGAQCTVTEKKYSEVKVGDKVLCAWQVI